MDAVIIVVFVTLAILIAVLQRTSHQRRITDKIHSIGGEVISIERKAISGGPFFIIGKGRTVYRIEYRKGAETKEGWVKFGDLFGPEWKL